MQILIDITIFTALLYFTSNTTNPFTNIYILSLTITTTILP